MNMTVIKRLNIEIIELYSKYKTFNIEYNENIIKFRLKNIELHITNNYPFQPPKVFIKEKPYIEFLIIKSNKIKHILYDYIKYECLCCSSIICPNNWTASYHIQKIIDEISNVNYLKCITKYHLTIQDIFTSKNIPLDIKPRILEFLL
jgi:hypothetical protein